ncbi:MAG: hypothetical protein H6807_08895 [Planctomycetes bacterium]|nr:hypothetical protein [Planctomycetota bacterium]
MGEEARSGRLPGGLPHETPREVTPGEILRLVLGVLVLLLVVDLLLVALDARLPINRTGHLLRAKWTLLETAAPERRVDWLVLGDSSGNQGVDPTRIRELTGLESLNLCTVGACLAVDDAWMLERWLDTRPAPDKVILIHVYDVWRRAEMGNSCLVNLPLDREQIEAARPAIELSSGKRRKILTFRWLPLLMQHESLSVMLRDPARFAANRSHLDELGFDHQDRADPERVRRNMAEHLAENRVTPPELSALNRAALTRIAELCAAREIELVIAFAPILDEMAELPEFRDYLARVAAPLETFAAEHPKVRLVFREPMRFSATELETVDHVVGAAARRYTDELVRQIGD